MYCRVIHILNFNFFLGVTAIDLILSQLLAQLIVMLVQIFLMLIVVFAIFSFNCEGSYFLASLLAVLQGLCGMSLGKKCTLL